MNSVLSSAQNLSTPYKPVASYFHDSDCVEYVREDVPTVYRRIDDFLTLALDMSTRELIGFRFKGFRNFYIRHLEEVHRRFGSDFLALVSVVERHVQDIGEDLFDERRREAYSLVRRLAHEDNVELRDLPEAA